MQSSLQFVLQFLKNYNYNYQKLYRYSSDTTPMSVAACCPCLGSLLGQAAHNTYRLQVRCIVDLYCGNDQSRHPVIFCTAPSYMCCREDKTLASTHTTRIDVPSGRACNPTLASSRYAQCLNPRREPFSSDGGIVIPLTFTVTFF